MKQIKEDSHRHLTRAEVAQIFQVSPNTITRWAEAGKLPVVKTLGGHRRYEAKAVLELAQRLTHVVLDNTEVHIEKEINMKKTVIELPAMYGDHHVLEVRRILLEMFGVEEVNASSCFRTVETTFDPSKTSASAIRRKLEEAGYTEELTVPVETTRPATQTNSKEKTFFRHTTAFEQAKHVVSFVQDVNYTGRPLWPCPGLGLIKETEFNAALQREASDG